MNEFFASIVASFKAHTAIWLAGGAVGTVGIVYIARTHPMSPMAALPAGGKPPKPKPPKFPKGGSNGSKPTGEHSVPPEFIGSIGNGGAFYVDGSHEAYESGVDNRVQSVWGRWLPSNEDLRAN